NDPDGTYRASFDDAREAFRDAVRDEVRRRAFEGSDPVMFEGKQCSDQAGNLLYRKSDRMLELLAKATCPEFRDKTELTGEGGGPVKVLAIRYPVKAASVEE